MQRIGFIIEQALGHVTHGKNLQANLARTTSLEAHWVLPKFETEGIGAKVPLYNSNWTVRASWQARRGLAEISRHTELDVLFFHTQVTSVLCHDWIKRIPSVISLDATPLQYDELGSFYGHTPGNQNSPLEKLKWKLNRDALKYAQQIVTWTDHAKHGLVEAYEVPADKVTVIPPGVTIKDWVRPTPRKLHDGPVRILFVGGNLERKGGLHLIEAFQKLRDERKHGLDTDIPPIELHMATLSEIAPMPGLFVYNNMKPNSKALKDLYHKCDIFCMPTLGDFLPMVLSEAGAAGLPCITTDVAAIPEVVRHDETGFIVPPNDPEALYTSLKQMVCNHEQRLRFGEQAVVAIRQRFDAERNAMRLLDLLKQQAMEAHADKARNGLREKGSLA